MIRRVVWFVVGVLLGGWVALAPSLAHAETIPATSGADTVGSWGMSACPSCARLVTAQAVAIRECTGAPHTTWVAELYAQWSSTQETWKCKLNGVDQTSFVVQKFCALPSTLSFNGSCPSVSSCPVGQNWTLSGSSCTRPDCVAPQTRNASTGVCEAPPCTSKAAVGGSAYFDYGTSPGGSFPNVVCSAGCLAVFSGTSPAGSAVVAGVKHYFAFGSYTYSGNGSWDSCTVGAGTPAPGSSAGTLPVSHCASNQIEGLINGKLNCWNVPGSGVAPVAAPTSAPVTAATGSSTTNVSTVGGTTTTTTTTNNISTGGTTVNVTSCTGGNCTSSTQETALEEDPTEGAPSAGTLSTVGDLAIDDTRTIQSVWDTRKAAIMATPLMSLASSLTSFPGGSGSCPAWAVTGSVFGVSAGGSISPPCWIWGVLRAFLLLTSLFVARRLIFGG